MGKEIDKPDKKNDSKIVFEDSYKKITIRICLAIVIVSVAIFTIIGISVALKNLKSDRITEPVTEITYDESEIDILENEKYSILGKSCLEFIKEYEDRGGSVMDGLGENSYRGKSIAEKRNGWKNFIRGFDYDLTSDCQIYMLFPEIADDYVSLILFAENDTITSYHVLWGYNAINISQYIKETEFSEVKQLKEPLNPTVLNLIGTDQDGKRWNTNDTCRPVFETDDYTVQFHAIKFVYETGRPLTNQEWSEMFFSDFYVSYKPEILLDTRYTITLPNEYIYLKQFISIMERTGNVPNLKGNALDEHYKREYTLWENGEAYMDIYVDEKGILKTREYLLDEEKQEEEAISPISQSSNSQSQSNYFQDNVMQIEQQQNNTTSIYQQENNEEKKLDDAGVPESMRFNWYPNPEVTITGTMGSSLTFYPDYPIALKGYWSESRWDVLKELYVPAQSRLTKGNRYTIKAILRYDELQNVEIISEE